MAEMMHSYPADGSDLSATPSSSRIFYKDPKLWILQITFDAFGVRLSRIDGLH